MPMEARFFTFKKHLKLFSYRRCGGQGGKNVCFFLLFYHTVADGAFFFISL